MTIEDTPKKMPQLTEPSEEDMLRQQYEHEQMVEDQAHQRIYELEGLLHKERERTAELEDMVRRLVKCLQAASEAVYRDTLNDDFDGILGLGWRDNEAEPLIAEAAQLLGEDE